MRLGRLPLVDSDRDLIYISGQPAYIGTNTHKDDLSWPDVLQQPKCRSDCGSVHGLGPSQSGNTFQHYLNEIQTRFLSQAGSIA